MGQPTTTILFAIIGIRYLKSEYVKVAVKFHFKKEMVETVLREQYKRCGFYTRCPKESLFLR